MASGFNDLIEKPSIDGTKVYYNELADIEYVVDYKDNINNDYVEDLETGLPKEFGQLGEVNYVPLPIVHKVLPLSGDNRKVLIQTDNLGSDSLKFSYSHGQLKYLAWKATLGLGYTVLTSCTDRSLQILLEPYHQRNSFAWLALIC